MNDFNTFLQEQEAVLLDGGMGTMLYNKGIFVNQCYDALNLSNPTVVEEVHREYVAAGAQVVETNTFGANAWKLKAYGLAENTEEINRRGVEIARRAAGTGVYVAGSMGPLGARIEPWGAISREEAREEFRRQAAALTAAGADLIILETFYDLSEIEQAIQAVRAAAPSIFLIASMTIDEDGTSLFGTPAEVFGKRLGEWGADAIGVNCSEGPAVMLEVAQSLRKITDLPLLISPNAGRPRSVEGRNFYMSSPEYFAEYTRRFLQIGVKMVGGCCGTTPAHTKAMAGAIRSAFPARRSGEQLTITAEDWKKRKQDFPETPTAEKSALAAKLSAGRFVSSIEIVPPRGTDYGKVIEHARAAEAAGVDALNIPDGPRASSRMSALATALLIHQHSRVETILHYTCRDRNILGIQSDLLGASALGVRNMLLVTGDPPKMGSYPDATGVFDIDSIGLVNVVKALNQGFDIGKNPIGRPTSYLIGVGVNPLAVDLEFELKRFAYKVEAGAEFAITQPVFDTRQLLDFLETLEQRGLKIPIVAGLWPLTSFRNAQFMRNEIPGAFVPDEIMTRMEAAVTKEDGIRIGMEIAFETIAAIADRVQGLQVSIPGGRIENAVALIAAAQKG